MNYLSLFSGIEAATEAWAPLGWKCVGVSEIEPFPCELLAQRHPDVPNLGDVTKITEQDIINLGPIDVIVFGSPCFTAGHTVLTARGLVPIESVTVGDNVWTHASRWKRVSHVMTRTAPTVVVNGQGHNAIRATPDHPFYAANTVKTWHGNGYTRTVAEPQWVHASGMTGQRWATPVNLTCPDMAPEILRSLDGAYLAGLYLGDGHIGRTKGRDKKSVILSVGDAKRDKILPLLRKAWGTVSELPHSASVTRIQLSRTRVADALIRDFGVYSHGKCIPVWAMCAERDWQEAFLQGVLDTDGSKFRSGYRVTTVSRALAVGLRLICARLGYSTSLYFEKRPETHVIAGRTVNQRDTWTVTMRKSNRTSELRTAEHAWGLVRSVTPAADDTVYDITVEDDHSFICDGIVVHNCQDLSVAGKRKGLDGARSGLFFTAMQIVGWARKHCGLRFPLWENVPGAFTSNQGADFAAVVDALAGLPLGTTVVPPKGWGTEGCALGPAGMVEWATLDAQWFGVAQRRRRVFAIADFGDWSSRPPILLEPESMRGDSAPSREAGEGVAGTLASRTGGGGFPGTDEACDGHVIPEQRSVLTSTTGAVAHCLNAGGMGRIDYESETMVISAAFKGGQGAAAGGIGYDEHVSPTLSSADSGSNRTPVVLLGFNSNAQPDEMRFDPELSAPLTCSQNSAICFTGDITHALNTANNGKGSSEDGTGRGVPTIAIIQGDTHGRSSEADASSILRTLRAEVGAEAVAEWGLAILDSLQSPEVLQSWLYGASLRREAGGDRSVLGNSPPPCSKSMPSRALQQVWVHGPDGRTPQGRGLAKQLSFEFGEAVSELPHAGSFTPRLLQRLHAGGQRARVLRKTLSAIQETRIAPLGQSQPAHRMSVRRLTPTECEKLQGFIPGHTAVLVNGKRAADGPRYKALGNSMAVPVMRWIGKQIDFVVRFC